MRIYVASSWRNPHLDTVIAQLRDQGHEVYDFRASSTAFTWSSLFPDLQKGDKVTAHDLRQALAQPATTEAFHADRDALIAAEAVVYVLPCGRDAAMELGYAAGLNQGIPGRWAHATLALVLEPVEPDLMVKFADGICGSMVELFDVLSDWERRLKRAGETG